MNIYRYKNCVIFNLWNYHLSWADCYPEIKMHATCIYNIVNLQFRLFDRSDNAEITVLISEKTRLHIIKTINSRVIDNSSEQNPTGIWNISKDDPSRDLLIENYVGNPDAKLVSLKNRRRAYFKHLNENLNSKIVRTSPPHVDIQYMLSILSPSRRMAYLQR